MAVSGANASLHYHMQAICLQVLSGAGAGCWYMSLQCGTAAVLLQLLAVDPADKFEVVRQYYVLQ